MASPQHQFILGLINKAMRQDEIQITYVEGNFLSKTDILPGLPPAILRHRPDLVGVKHSGQICIGDAKTASDVGSIRTKEQLIDYTTIELNGMKCHVYIGIPSRIIIKKIKKGIL